MATEFPTDLDQYANVPENQAVTVQHRARHQDIEDAMEAVQAKVGVNGSAVPTSLDYRVQALEDAVVVGNNWTPNAALVGAVDGSLARILMPTNTVLGRSSVGNVEAKVCTDYAFSLFVGVDAAAVRTTLGAAAGAWPANIGGTGQTSYAVGDLLYASGATTLSKLADVATGNALISGGVGVAPLWGKIGLTTHVSGTLAVGNGGTGINSLTAGNYINALNATTFQQRTPAQVRTDLGITTVSEGTYTPTLTNVLNVTSSSAKVCQYTRIGNTITVSGQVDITPTAGAASTTVGISLPVASALTASEQCAGAACEGGTGQYAPGAILADAANDRASLVFKSVGAGAVHAMLFTFTYRVL